MKRRTFIKGTTSTIAGIGFPAVHSFQSQFKIAQNPFDTYVTMDKEKVSFYSDVIKEKIMDVVFNKLNLKLINKPMIIS